ncbi:hypothetical protein L195_g064484, partial [Trifolium pratense]
QQQNVDGMRFLFFVRRYPSSSSTSGKP